MALTSSTDTQYVQPDQVNTTDIRRPPKAIDQPLSTVKVDRKPDQVKLNLLEGTTTKPSPQVPTTGEVLTVKELNRTAKERSDQARHPLASASPYDVVQEEGSQHCFLLSGIGIISLNKSQLGQLIEPLEKDWKVTIYNHEGNPVTQIIKSKDLQGENLMSAEWVRAVEKAYTNIYGAAANGGNPEEALSALTGKETKTFWMNTVDKDEKPVVKDEQIEKALDEEISKKGGVVLSGNVDVNSGLCHAVTILGKGQIIDGEKKYFVRDQADPAHREPGKGQWLTITQLRFEYYSFERITDKPIKGPITTVKEA